MSNTHPEMENSPAAPTIEEITLADRASQDFLGQWNRLVSTTNWEKGRIIQEWRSALVEAGANVEEFSDEAWASRVKNVSGQHVGRLRRAFERFGATFKNYKGLYWSHFQAALEWEDAEMWLEGSVQNDWSVSEMRRHRAETLGQVEADQTDATAAALSDQFDEDSETVENEARAGVSDKSPSGTDIQSGPIHDGPDFGEEDDSVTGTHGSLEGLTETSLDRQEPNIPHRPFADLPSLPEDLSSAFEGLKLAVLRHKTTEWQHVQPSEVRAHLMAMLQLVEETAA